jgi:hypothetical protein
MRARCLGGLHFAAGQRPGLEYALVAHRRLVIRPLRSTLCICSAGEPIGLFRFAHSNPPCPRPEADPKGRPYTFIAGRNHNCTHGYCDNCMAQPPVPPDVGQLWLARVEK